MAPDLLRLRPDVVIFHASGYMRVDYGRLDVKCPVWRREAGRSRRRLGPVVRSNNLIRFDSLLA
jgi:hypothetical protein